MGLTDEILESAVRMLARHPLRSLDALQLASALAAHATDPSLTEIVCFDKVLGAAARAEGLLAVP